MNSDKGHRRRLGGYFVRLGSQLYISEQANKLTPLVVVDLEVKLMTLVTPSTTVVKVVVVAVVLKVRLRLSNVRPTDAWSVAMLALPKGPGSITLHLNSESVNVWIAVVLTAILSTLMAHRKSRGEMEFQHELLNLGSLLHSKCEITVK